MKHRLLWMVCVLGVLASATLAARRMQERRELQRAWRGRRREPAANDFDARPERSPRIDVSITSHQIPL